MEELHQAIEDALTFTFSHGEVTTDDDDNPHHRLLILRDRKTTEPWISMSQQGSETLNRTFAELKSKDEERRRAAAYDLYQLVSTASRGEMFEMFSLLMLTKFRAVSRQVPGILQQRQLQDHPADQQQ